VSGEANRRRTKDKFAAGEPLYVTLVSLSNNGDIRVVYPRLGANDPLADGREIERHFYSTRPLGMERFVVLVTKQPVDLSFLEFSGSARSARSPLESVLVRSGIRSRDSGTVIPEAPDQWGVVHLDLNVVEK
jgi:hypothetical protein